MKTELDKPRLISTRLRAEAERPSENPVRVKALLLEAAEALERHLLNRLEDELASSSLALNYPSSDDVGVYVMENGERWAIAGPVAREIEKRLSAASPAATATTDSTRLRIVTGRLVTGDLEDVCDQQYVAAQDALELERELAEQKEIAQRQMNDAEQARIELAEFKLSSERAISALTSSAIASKDSAFRCYDSERWPGTGRCPQQCGSCATRYTPPTSACTDLNIPVVGATSDTPRTDAVIAAADACPETRVVFLIHQLANLAKDLERKLDKALSDPRSNVGMCQRDARECREMELERDDLKRELSALKAPIADDIVEGLRVVTQRRGCKIQQGDVLAVERAINALTRSAIANKEKP